ncbi:ABC transporter ATP-binding protein [Streptomyces sp. NPDC057496]|uniref:ABC transporter ATP-binding protein n=1 Tax=Streptomyces sp. NPDC057496 TaxID=3346149 RepID=UPI003682DCA1
MTRRPLLRLLSAKSGPYLAISTTWIVLRSTALAAGFLIKAVFDALAGPDTGHSTVWVLVAALVGCEAARLFLWYGVVLSRLEPGYTYRMRARLQDNMLRGIFRRPASVALGRPVGDVASRLGDDVDEVGVFAIWSASNISRLVIAVAALVVMLLIDPVVTAALLVPVVVVILLGRALTGPIGRAREASRRAGGEVSTIVGESVHGVQALKVNRAERRMVDRLRSAGEVRLAAAVREDLLTAVQGALFTNVAALGTGLLLIVASGRMRDGEFTIGDLALFVYYIQFVSDAVNALGMFMSRIRRANVSLGRIAEVAGGLPAAIEAAPTYVDGEQPPAPSEPAKDAEPLRAMTVTGLTYRYPGSDRGIVDAAFTVEAGALTVITGRTGAGKSTLLRSVLGMLPADRGEIRWNGEPVDRPDDWFVPPRSAHVPQVPRLFTGSLRGNVKLGLERDDDAVLAAIRTAALERDLEAMPKGIDTMIGFRGLRLSGGQVQRLAAARMLVRGTDLLACDDLSNALDPATERLLWDRLLAEGRTVLAVSHRIAVLERADRIVLVDDGAVIDSGTSAELLERRPLMRELWQEAASEQPTGAESVEPAR